MQLCLAWIVGHTPGLDVAHWHGLTRYAQGKLDGVEEFAPPGGANFMSSKAVAQAMLGGLERGESGKSYLIGDENMSWKAFFELWFAEAAGRRAICRFAGDIRWCPISRCPISILAAPTMNLRRRKPPCWDMSVAWCARP